MILVFLIQFHKVGAPAPNADDEVGVLFRLSLGGTEQVCVDGIQLQLMTAAADEQLHEGSHLFCGCPLLYQVIFRFI